MFGIFLDKLWCSSLTKTKTMMFFCGTQIKPFMFVNITALVSLICHFERPLSFHGYIVISYMKLGRFTIWLIILDWILRIWKIILNVVDFNGGSTYTYRTLGTLNFRMKYTKYVSRIISHIERWEICGTITVNWFWVGNSYLLKSKTKICINIVIILSLWFKNPYYNCWQK